MTEPAGIDLANALDPLAAELTLDSVEEIAASVAEAGPAVAEPADLARTARRAAPNWTHWCDPPRRSTGYGPDRSDPSLEPGEVWFCGCGRAYGVVAGTSGRGPRWGRVSALDEVRLAGPRQ